jgi:hypothetical protein
VLEYRPERGFLPGFMFEEKYAASNNKGNEEVRELVEE